MHESPVTPKLAAALLQAQRAMPHVPNDAKNSHHNYSYTSAEAIFAASRKALNEAGLVLSLQGSTVSKSEGIEGALVMASFLLIHETGESLPYSMEFPAIPRAGHPLDKAVSAALTTGEAYLLRGLLLIPRCAESDDVASLNDTKETKPEPKAAAAPKPAPAKGSRDAKVSLEAQEELVALCREVSVSGEAVAARCKSEFKTSFKNLTPVQFAKLREWVASQKKAPVQETAAA